MCPWWLLVTKVILSILLMWFLPFKNCLYFVCVQEYDMTINGLRYYQPWTSRQLHTASACWLAGRSSMQLLPADWLAADPCSFCRLTGWPQLHAASACWLAGRSSFQLLPADWLAAAPCSFCMPADWLAAVAHGFCLLTGWSESIPLLAD